MKFSEELNGDVKSKYLFFSNISHIWRWV